MQFRLHPLAYNDFIDSYNYYESQSKGLGEKFYIELKAAYQIIEKHPARARIIKGYYRLFNLITFPFQIIYTYNKDLSRVSIIAIHHSSKNPRKRFRNF